MNIITRVGWIRWTILSILGFFNDHLIILTFMKYTFTLLFSFLMISGLLAQKDYIRPEESRSKETIRPLTYRSGQGVAMDTLFPPIFGEDCANQVFALEPTGQWGFVAGTNGFLDQEKAQKFRFDDAESFSVVEAGVFFASASVVGDGALKLKIYAVDENTEGPGDLLGMSDELKVSDILIDEEVTVATIFEFSTPAQVEGDEFFVSVDLSNLYTSNDTVGILQSDVDCGSGEDAWELFNGQWARMFSNWGDLQSDLFMAVVVDFQESTSTEDIEKKVSISMFPSPATDVVNLTYALKDPTPVILDVFSLDGKKILTLPQGRVSSGTYNIQIDVREWLNGPYLARITTDKGVVTRKLMVMH